MDSNLKTINEIDLSVDSDNEIEELTDKMTFICSQTSNSFYKFKKKVNNIHNLLENNFNNKFENNNFDDHELIEEQIDDLIYDFLKIKEFLKKGRIIKFYKEKKENNKKKELLYARNALAYYGINPTN
jgi:hypothetical protein